MLRIGFKFYPACRYTSSALDATAALVSENELKADDVDRIMVSGQKHLSDNFRIYEPAYMIQAQFSIPYVVDDGVGRDSRGRSGMRKRRL